MSQRPTTRTSYARQADPRSAAFRRLLQPIGLGVVGLGALLVPASQLAEVTLRRVGVVAILAAVVWASAVVFALGTMRLIAGTMAIVCVIGTARIGVENRTEREFVEFQALSTALATELNTLDGYLVTVEDIAERIRSAATLVVEAEATQPALLRGIEALEKFRETDSAGGPRVRRTVVHLEARLTELHTAIIGASSAARTEINAGWDTLGLGGSPYVAIVSPKGLQTTQETEDDGSTSGPAPARARSRAATIAERASDVRQLLATAEWIAHHFEGTSLFRDSRRDSDDDASAAIGMPEALAAYEAEPRAESDRNISEVFCPTQVDHDSLTHGTVLAGHCVEGCPSRDDPCNPRLAKSHLLLGFQAELESLTEHRDLGDRDPLQARLKEVRSELGLLDDPLPLHTLALEGADVFIGDLVGLFTQTSAPARVGGWGWLVIGLAMVIAYRLIESTNDRRTPGPVLVAPESPNDATCLQATQLIRSLLAAADLEEPSPVPGGDAVSGVVASAGTSAIDNTALQFLASALQSTAFPKRGVEVTVSYQPVANENSGARHRVMIRASWRRTGRLLFSQPFEAETLDEVTTQATYFAAERLLDAGWTTPAWLQWDSNDGTALRAYQETMIDNRGPHTSSNNRTNLERAVAASPGTGAALVALSHSLVLHQEYAAAAHYLLLARIRHPDFLTCRYRLGVTLSMISTNVKGYWLSEPFHRGGANGTLDDIWKGRLPASSDDPTAEEKRLLDAAIDELTAVEDALQIPSLLLRSLQQSQRRYWLGLLQSRRRRVALRDAAKSARALTSRRRARAREDGDDAYRYADSLIATTVNRSSDDWIVRYNAACYAANKAKDTGDDSLYTDALAHLRRAREARNGYQLYRHWVEIDPDLEPLRCHLRSSWASELDKIFALAAEPSPL